MLVEIGLWLWFFLTLVLKVIAWIVGAVLFCVWWCQGSLLYMPSFQDRKGELRQLKHNRPGWRHPGEQGITYENHFLTCEDGVRIHVWVIPTANGQHAPTIVFFHGNAGNIGFRIPIARDLEEFTRSNVVLVEYRGYGDSDGEPTELGLNLDAQAVLDWLVARPDIDSKKIFMYGASLGGAVAASVTYRNPDKVAGLIVENTFTGIDDMAILILERLKIKWNKGLKRFLYFYLSNKWQTLQLMPHIETPVLFMSGLKDELIPPAHMKRLFEAAVRSRKREWHAVPHGEHNDTHVKGGDEFYQMLGRFIADVVGRPVASETASSPKFLP